MAQGWAFVRPIDRHQDARTMAFSFLYQAFCRLLAVIRRLGRERSELAIETRCCVTRLPSCAARSHDRRSNRPSGPSSRVFRARFPSRGAKAASSSQQHCCAGIERWQARNVSSELSERTTPVKLLIRDRDAKFPRTFDEVFRADGIRIVRTPVRAPAR